MSADEEKPVIDYRRPPMPKKAIKRGVLIAFCTMLVLFSAVPYFVSEAAWSRGVGDLTLVAALLVIVVLYVWNGS